MKRIAAALLLLFGASARAEDFKDFVPGLPTATPPYGASDYFPIVQSGQPTKKVPGNTIVTTTDPQTVTNKTIDCNSNTCRNFPGGSGSPGGTSGQLQWNSAGAFAGLTIGGDATLNTGTGALTIGSLGGKAVSLAGALTTSGGASGVTLAYPIGGPFTFTFPSASKTLMATDFSNAGGGTGVATALGVNVGTAGSFVVNGGALGTPASGTATNLTGLPLTSGVTGILPGANGGTGVANTGFTLTLGGSASLPAAPASTQCLHMANTGAITPTGSDCGAGGSSTGFGVDGGTSAQTVTGTAAIANATRLVKIATGWTTGTLTLPVIANVSADSAICIDDGGFLSGSATLTVAANATDTGASGGIVGSTGIVSSMGAFTTTGTGLCFRVSGTHTWTVESGASFATSTAPTHQFANGVGINGLAYAQPAIGDISGLGTGVATAAGNAISAAGGLTTTIGSGSQALGTSAIASGACATAIDVTVANVLTTDVVLASFNGDPTAVTGYIPSTSGMLTIIAYPTAGAIHFKVCNNTSGSITPGAITLNWRVAR